MEMVNGYVFLDLTKSNVYSKALKVLGTDKPVVIKDGQCSPYFVDSLTLDGTNVVITKGGKTITIANDNTITNVGDISTILENIVDSQGNKIFIEGEGTLTTLEGLNITYNKWSLSGTHLMFVVAGEIADTTVIPSNFVLVDYTDLPSYIIDKIIPGKVQRIDVKTISMYADDYSVQNNSALLLKNSDTNIRIIFGAVTLNGDRSFRVQFDLLIDQD